MNKSQEGLFFEEFSRTDNNERGVDARVGESDLPAAGGLILIRTSRQTTCKNAPMMKAVHPITRQAIFFRPRCKLWRCPDCAKINSDLWQMRATFGCHTLLSDNQQMSFVTLTSHEKLSPDATVKKLPDAWNKLRLRIFHKFGKVAYLVIPERHEDMRIHLHALVLVRAGKRWWKDNARKSGLGYMAEEDAIYNPFGAARYVSKYLSKQLSIDCWAKGFHRVRTSQNWPKLPLLEKPEGWTFSVIQKGDTVAREVAALKGQEYIVALADSAAAWALIKGGELLTDDTLSSYNA